MVYFPVFVNKKQHDRCLNKWFIENNGANMLYAWEWEKKNPSFQAPYPLPSVSNATHTQISRVLIFCQTMLNIYTKGPKWAADWRWNQCPSSPSQSALDPTYAWLIHQTTSILPLLLVNGRTPACTRPRSHYGWQALANAKTSIHPQPSHKHTHIHTRKGAYCTQILPRLSMKHADTAPSIMVNTSNSISFLDSWSLDRYGSDSAWFLTGCLAPHTPLSASLLSLFPMKSVWVVKEHAAKIDSLTYYLLLFL